MTLTREWARFPMTLIVEYAVAAPNAPSIAERTATDLWVGEAGTGGIRPRRALMKSPAWLITGVLCFGKRNCGLAMRRTPTSATIPAKASRVVKGS